MKLRLPILFLIIFIASCSRIPAISREDNFLNPPQQYGVDCWWWWLNGNVTKEAITSDLEEMKAKGFCGAMLIDAGGHNQRGNKDIPAGPLFSSEEWVDLFVYALDEAERLGLEIGFNIQSGWNLGGPCITPQYAAKALTFSRTIVKEGEDSVFLEKPESKNDFYQDIAVLAFPIDESRISDEPIRSLAYKLGAKELGGSAPDCRFLLENKVGKPSKSTPYLVAKEDVRDISQHMDPEGNLRWACPEGKWVILRVGFTCTGAKVSTCSEGWDGPVLDYMSKDAFRFYADKVLDPILAKAGHHVGTTLKNLETDSWECGGMNWTEGFEKEFKAMNGYDIIPFLPIIGGYVVDDMGTTDAFLADFRKAVAEAIAQNHYKEFAQYAHQKEMGIQPESAGPHAGPLDGIKNYSYSDIVMSEFWAPSPHRPTPERRFFVKQASSAAHIYGKKIVGAESFTTIGPHWNDEIWHDQKPSFDREICSGLNRCYFHTFTCSPSEMGVPGQEYFAGTHVNPRVTWWEEGKAFIDYMCRVQSLVQDARFNADVLYYYGDHVPNVFPFKHSNMAGAMPGYDYDVTDEEVLLRLKVDKEGRVVVPGGLAYRVLVLPDHKILSSAALSKVESLLKRGATVLGAKPEKCVTLVGGEKARARFHAIADKVWGAQPEPQGSRRYGKGTLVWGTSAREWLLGAGIPQDFSVAQDPQLEGFDYIHYTLGESEMYFISNMDDSEKEVSCTFRISGRQPELWNALDGTVTKLEAFSQSEGCTAVPLHFDACGSAVIMFKDHIATSANGPARSNSVATEVCQTLEGPWNVAFRPELGGPASAVFDELIDWTASSDEGIRYYSGPAVYSKAFSLDEDPGENEWFVQLENILDTGFATVKLNGRDLGVTWTKPFRVKISEALKQGDNLLEIKVVNSWYNRVAGDELHPEKKPYTKTNIVLGHDFRGKDSPIVLSPSGLLGPVTVRKTISQQ